MPKHRRIEYEIGERANQEMDNGYKRAVEVDDALDELYVTGGKNDHAERDEPNGT